MCLPRIGTIRHISGDQSDSFAVVDVAGTSQRVSLLCLPNAAVGDAISIHAGFALSVVPEGEVETTLAMIEVVKRPPDPDGDEVRSVVG